MSHTKTILAILAVIVALGACVSGCSRNRGQTAMAVPKRKAQTARPAEVLSASVTRPPRRDAAPAVPAFARSSPAPAYAHPDAPPSPHAVAYTPVQRTGREPVVLARGPAAASPAAVSRQPGQAQAARHAVTPPPPARMHHSTPDLVAAMAAMQPIQAFPDSPIQYAPLPAPIPDLSPIRSPAPFPADGAGRPAEIMVTVKPLEFRPQEMRETPIPPSNSRTIVPKPAIPSGWVASPATAMRSPATRY